MKKLLLLALGLLIAVALAGFFWQRSRALGRQLGRARVAIGTHEVGQLLEQLARDYADDPEVCFLHARQLRLEGQLERAVTRLNRAAELGWPRSAIERESLLLRAQTDFPAVEPALQALLDADPHDREVLLTLSLGWSRQHQLARAEAMARALLARDPADAAAHCILGRIRLQQGQPHDARPDLELAVRDGAGWYFATDARLLLANCLLELGEFTDALHLYRDCRAQDPENVLAHFGVGRCHWFLGQWDEAAAAFDEVLRRRPDQLDALAQLAYVHEERGDLRGALRLLEKALTYDPTWHDLFFRMAKLCRALGQTDKATEYQRRAVALQKSWARPRSGPAPLRDPYTGEELGTARAAGREPARPKE
jgi:tetratricopeptide (TPR) repeat protein